MPPARPSVSKEMQASSILLTYRGSSCTVVPTKALAAAIPNSSSNDRYFTPVPRGRYNSFQFIYWKHLDSKNSHNAWFWLIKYTP